MFSRAMPQIQVKCPNCGQPFATSLEQIIDGGLDPQAKSRFLSGRTNVASCPACGVDFRLSTPLLYHDGRKELLITFIPMELGMPRDEQERLIGQMTQAIIQSLPQEERKGYLFVPKNALTLQGMVEMILEGDGITKAMIEARRERLGLVEKFLDSDPETWAALAQAEDANLDEDFFGMLLASADAAMNSGRQDVADQVLHLRDRLLELTTTGKHLVEEAEAQEKVFEEVSEALNELGDSPTREDLAKVIIEQAQISMDRVPMLVSLLRGAMDYQFFLDLGREIESAEGEQKTFLTTLRDNLTTLVQETDRQAHNIAAKAVETLQEIVNSEDLDGAIRANLEGIDDTFLAVLSANLQNAEQQKNSELVQRLQEVFDRVMSIMQESAPPPLRLINELIRVPDVEQARATIKARAPEFGPSLLQLFDVLMTELATQGGPGGSPVMIRLQALREAAAEALGEKSDGGSGTPIIRLGDREIKPPAPKADGDGRGSSESGIVLPFTRNRPKKS